jgi:hypothetical protein
MVQPYSRGEVNRIIDAFIHPLARHEIAFLLLDGVLHAAVERNPSS